MASDAKTGGAPAGSLGGASASFLPPRRRAVLEFVTRYLRERGFPPSIREIAQATGLASPATVHAHLAALERDGYLRRDPTKPRAIEVLAGRAAQGSASDARSSDQAALLPLVGRVAAGQPLLADEAIEEYVPVPAEAGGAEGDFVLAVRGDSMRDAGILDGDHVVVRRQDTARNGEIVVALVGDEEATVKRFFEDRGEVRLEPANPRHRPIRSREVRILGRVVGVLRRL